MTGVSVLTLVRNRADHLNNLVEGLARSDAMPSELVVIDMSDEPVSIDPQPFAVRIDRLATTGLPLAKARNRAATLARHDRLVFLDVDCIPTAACVSLLAATLEERDALLCADVRYLGPGAVVPRWTEEGLLADGTAHPIRTFPADGLRQEPNPGLFWSLAFAIRKPAFEALGGFDEGFVGYGAEDTDFGFRAADAGLPLLFVGGAIACHQYHDSHDPPVQHVVDIVRNAQIFNARWGRWPMEGWLRAFTTMGLVDWTDNRLTLRRLPTPEEHAATRSTWPLT
jgi:GT2 family glycosyltransferase